MSKRVRASASKYLEAGMDEAGGEQGGQRRGWASRAVLWAIRFYQRGVSPLTPPTCRFTPTCSHYTYEAIERYGVWRGLGLGAWRVCRCNPLCKGGFDPVPDLRSASRKLENEPPAS